MNLLVLIGIGSVAVIAIASSASKKSAPRANRPDKFVSGWPGGIAKRNQMIATWNTHLGNSAYDARSMWEEARKAFSERRHMLPANASGLQDVYTKERFILPRGFGMPWPLTGSVDEFGREPEGLPSNFGATLLTVTKTVLPLVPGVGPAASAALAYAIAIGQGKSQQDALIAAARSAVPIQYQVAFDLGVGIASGESVTDAAKNALFKQLPGSEKYYKQGKAMLAPVKVFQLP